MSNDNSNNDNNMTLTKDVVLQALANHKSVVTANKALLVKYLDELHEASLQHKSILAYEAAICGGVPIIHTLQTCYTGDVIYSIQGICNGTTNYMLGKMEQGVDYDEVLKEAQELGYAEANPSADVDGHDVCAKICILAKLAFGVTVNPTTTTTTVPCRGISSITSVDFEYAKLLGCTIKLVGTAMRLSKYGEHDGALSVFVTPQMVANSHLLASARGSGNAIAIKSANLGIASYTGPGAGRYPTANSIVADVMRIVNGIQPTNPFPVSTTTTTTTSSIIDLNHDYTSSFYIRIPFMDSLGIIRKIGELAEKHEVSIHSVLQNPIQDRAAADFVVTTEEAKMSQVEALCEDIDKEGFARSYPLYMPLLMELH